MVDAWIWEIGRDVGRNFQITANSRVSSRHFKGSDYKTTPAGMREVNGDAVPSNFLWKKSSTKKQKTPHPLETSNERAKHPKKKDNEELETKTELETSKKNKLTSVQYTFSLPARNLLRNLSRNCDNRTCFQTQRNKQNSHAGTARDLPCLRGRVTESKSIGKRAELFRV